eukprot:g235.t1
MKQWDINVDSRESVDGAPVDETKTREGIKRQMEKYHDALLRGRHPKSFSLKSSVFWRLIESARARMEKVRSGQPMDTVFSEGGEDRISCGKIDEMKDVISTDDQTKNVRRRRTSTTSTCKLDQFLSRERRLSSVGSLGIAGSVDSKSVSSMGKRRNKIANHLRKKIMSNRKGSAMKNKMEQQAVLASAHSRAKVFFGSKVAFEQPSLQGPSLFLTLTASGKFIVAPRDSGGQYIFTLVDLENQSDQRPVHFGESCWLGISTGVGDRWQQGGVVGTKMKHAVNLIDDRHAEDETMGTAVPIPTYMPADFEHRMGRADHKERLERNTLPLAIGKWKMQPALRAEKHFNLPSACDAGGGGVDHHVHHHHFHQHGHHRRGGFGKQLFNMARVYIEQDWFVLTTEDSKAKSSDAVLGGGNTQNSDRVFMRKLTMTHDERDRNLVAASGIWTMYVVETQSMTIGRGGKKSAAKKVENLLYRARMQLHKSREMRNGANEYGTELRGGKRFPVKIRRLRQAGDENQTLDFYHRQNDDSRRHFAEGRSRWKYPHRQLERVLRSQGKRTRIVRAAENFLAPDDTDQPEDAMFDVMARAQSSASKSRAKKEESQRRRQAAALSEWFKKKCGADLGEIHEQIANDLKVAESGDGSDVPSHRHHRRHKRGLLDEEENDGAPVEDLPIYKRLIEEDARATRIFKHRQKNAALVDLYATLFTDVEY